MPRIVDHTALSVSADQQGMQVYDMTTNSVWLYSGTSWEETESGIVMRLIKSQATLGCIDQGKVRSLSTKINLEVARNIPFVISSIS